MARPRKDLVQVEPLDLATALAFVEAETETPTHAHMGALAHAVSLRRVYLAALAMGDTATADEVSLKVHYAAEDMVIESVRSWCDRRFGEIVRAGDGETED